VNLEAHSTLDDFRREISGCDRCDLCKTRTTLVFGAGDPKADLMFVGEAPGKQEDLNGEPFVGTAGKLLDELLESIGLDRGRVYIANVLKCRPPGNRDPKPSEIETCVPFLNEQVRIIAPKVIVTLGNFATKYLLQTTEGITKLRGRLFRVDGRQIVPVYHPAAALYTPAKKDVLLEDFQRIRVVLDRPTDLSVSSMSHDSPPVPLDASGSGVEQSEDLQLF